MNKPIKIGLLPLYIKLYDDVWPEMRPRITGFYNDVCTQFENRGVNVVRSEPCRIREEFEEAVAVFEREGTDAIVTLHLAYSPSLESIGALTRTPLPLIVLDTSETFDFTGSADPDAVMYNHGIHGAQDMCTMLIRSGKRFCVEAGHYTESDVIDRAVQDAAGLRAARGMKHARVGIVGAPFPGMGDFAVPAEQLRRELGIEVLSLGHDEAERLLSEVEDAEISEEQNADRLRYEVRIDEDTHRRTLRAGLALRRFEQRERLSALTVNFLDITRAGLGLMPFTECCKAMERGTGYAGEGDVLTAALCGALLSVFRDATFTEMFCADWKNHRIFLSHMGEVNPGLLEGKPQIRPKPFAFSDAEDTTFLCGALRAGEGVYVNLAPLGPGRYRLILAKMRAVEMPPHAASENSVRGLLCPGGDVARFLERYSRAGGTHHSVFVYGDAMRALRVFGGEMGFEVTDLSETR